MFFVRRIKRNSIYVDGGKNLKKTVVMGRTKSDAKKGKREKIKLIQLHMPIKNNAWEQATHYSCCSDVPKNNWIDENKHGTNAYLENQLSIQFRMNQRKSEIANA